MSSGADLFVVCKQCQAEVSPYITECPYCGARLRKRAPKLEKARRETERRERRAEGRLGRLRPGEIPGIRAEARPYATIALVLAGIVGPILWRAGAVDFGDLAVVDDTLGGSRWWHVLTAPFVYHNSGYMLAALAAIALFGWLLERRQGPGTTLFVFALGGFGGMAAAAALETGSGDLIAAGGNGAALALLCAWAVPDLLERRAGSDTESDLLGVAVIAAVLFLLPLAAEESDALAGLVGALAGLVVGWPLAALRRGRG
jgi:membrane associated rhomboid family serine protease